MRTTHTDRSSREGPSDAHCARVQLLFKKKKLDKFTQLLSFLTKLTCSTVRVRGKTGRARFPPTPPISVLNTASPRGRKTCSRYSGTPFAGYSGVPMAGIATRLWGWGSLPCPLTFMCTTGLSRKVHVSYEKKCFLSAEPV